MSNVGHAYGPATSTPASDSALALLVRAGVGDDARLEAGEPALGVRPDAEIVVPNGWPGFAAAKSSDRVAARRTGRRSFHAAAAASVSNSGHLPPNPPPSGVPTARTRRCGSPSAFATSLRAPNSDCVEVSMTSVSSASTQAVQRLRLEVALVDPRRGERALARDRRPGERPRPVAVAVAVPAGDVLRQVLGVDRLVAAAADAGMGLGVHRARSGRPRRRARSGRAAIRATIAAPASTTAGSASNRTMTSSAPSAAACGRARRRRAPPARRRTRPPTARAAGSAGRCPRP